MGSRELVCHIDGTADGPVTQVRCEGDLVAGTSDTLKRVVKPLIVPGAHVVLDCEGVGFVDSMGLGAMVGLKVSSMNAGNCTLECVNMPKRVRELMRITGLAGLFGV